MTVDGATGIKSEGGLRAPFVAPGWQHRRGFLEPCGHPLVMGIINTTPDSFFEGSRHEGIQSAVAAGLKMVAQGADLLDLGAESSRPGADPVGSATEQERLLPVLEALRRETDIPITVDTVRSDTAKAALDAGADAINDISAGLIDAEMLPLAAMYGCGLILMHMQGMPRSMQNSPQYDDNLKLLKNLGTVAGDRPLLLGASRKSFISQIALQTGATLPVIDRLPGSLAALAAAFDQSISMVRVHDVAASIQFYRVLQAMAEETC